MMFIVKINGSREQAIGFLHACAAADSYAIDEFGRLLIMDFNNHTFMEVKDATGFDIVFDENPLEQISAEGQLPNIKQLYDGYIRREDDWPGVVIEECGVRN